MNKTLLRVLITLALLAGFLAIGGAIWMLAASFGDNVYVRAGFNVTMLLVFVFLIYRHVGEIMEMNEKERRQ